MSPGGCICPVRERVVGYVSPSLNLELSFGESGIKWFYQNAIVGRQTLIDFLLKIHFNLT